MAAERAERLGRAVLVCLALYAVVLFASPLLHHDLDCHLKSPQHCAACLACPLAPRAEPAAAPGIALDSLSSRPGGFPSGRVEAILVGRLSGRSPPL